MHHYSTIAMAFNGVMVSIVFICKFRHCFSVTSWSRTPPGTWLASNPTRHQGQFISFIWVLVMHSNEVFVWYCLFFRLTSKNLKEFAKHIRASWAESPSCEVIDCLILLLVFLHTYNTQLEVNCLNIGRPLWALSAAIHREAAGSSTGRGLEAGNSLLACQWNVHHVYDALYIYLLHFV